MPKQWYEYIKKQQEKKAAEELEKEQKAYIELWLTEEEIAAASNMTTAELYEKAQERAAQAERCMTAEELAEGLTPKQIKERIEYRQKLFAMLLTQDETDGNTASKKLALCQERLDILQQEVTVNGEKKPLFDDNTLFASKWSQLQDLPFHHRCSEPEYLRRYPEELPDRQPAEGPEVPPPRADRPVQ